MRSRAKIAWMQRYFLQAHYLCPMLLLGEHVISEEIFDEQFICDIKACKGACCVQGDSGAPLEEDELDKLDENLEAVLPYLPKKGQEALRRQGAFVVDVDGDYTTPLVAEKKECAYTVFAKDGTAKCGIELAWQEGKSNFQKPISCHLYPIRVAKLKEGSYALNYHKWQICKAACALGKKEQVSVFDFLKEPLTKRFGEDFVNELEEAQKAYLEYSQKK